MKRDLIITEDGSASIYVEKIGESYHSHFGAISESLWVYIEAGLKYSVANPIKILEIGFGTGLNAFLSWDEAIKSNRKTTYYAIEKYPLGIKEWSSLNYKTIDNIHSLCKFDDLHLSKWNEWVELNNKFSLFKSQASLEDFSTDLKFDLIYFDAFSPEAQPELWTEEIFSKLYRCLNLGGLLLTYSVKGTVKRALKSVGFKIDLLPGPKGKREIMRAIK